MTWVYTAIRTRTLWQIAAEESYKSQKFYFEKQIFSIVHENDLYEKDAWQ